MKAGAHKGYFSCGHAYEPENIYEYKGHAQCRICKRQAANKCKERQAPKEPFRPSERPTSLIFRSMSFSMALNKD